MFFYTLSYLDVLGYCVSLLNIVRSKAPLLEQKDRIWVVDGILGQQSFNIVTFNNKFSNYLRQFELSFYFFQSNSQPHQWTTFIPKLLYILYVPHFQLPLAEHLSFLQIPSLLESQEDTVHYVSLEPGLDTEEGCKACEQMTVHKSIFSEGSQVSVNIIIYYYTVAYITRIFIKNFTICKPHASSHAIFPKTL